MTYSARRGATASWLTALVAVTASCRGASHDENPVPPAPVGTASRALLGPPAGDAESAPAGSESAVGVITGTVRTPDGAPAAGARVGLLTRQYVHPEFEPPVSFLSDHPNTVAGPDGAFTLLRCPLGVEWHVTAGSASNDCIASRPSAPCVLTREHPSARVDLLLRRPAQLDVVVQDDQGRELADSVVTWHSGMHSLGAFAKRVSPGRHRFAGLAPGAVPVVIEAAGWAPECEFVEVREAEQREVVVRMVRPVAVRGRVVDDRGAPAPGVRVAWDPARDDAFGAALSGDAESAGDGSFVVAGLRAGRYRLRADAGGDSDDAVADVEAPADGLVLRVLRPGGITFRPRLPEGAAVPGDVRHSVGNAARTTYRVGTVETSGPVWRVPDLTPGRRTVRVQAEGYVSFDLTADVVPGGDTFVGEIALVPCVTWRGRVVDAEGRPVAVAFLQRLSELGWPHDAESRVRTDADGTFVVRGVEPETYVLGAEGFAQVRLRVGLADLPATVMLPRGARIDVRVVDADGRAVPGGLLRALPASSTEDRSEDLRWVTIDERGHGEVRLPPGRWKIGDTGGPWREVEAVDGADLEVEVVK